MQLGTAHGAVVCPWDVPDVEHVPDQKVEFLLALHALLIGEAHDAEGLVRTLDADEEALLRDAITMVSKRCADSRERPREQLLIEAVHERQRGWAGPRRRKARPRCGPAGPAALAVFNVSCYLVVPQRRGAGSAGRDLIGAAAAVACWGSRPSGPGTGQPRRPSRAC